MPDRPLQRPEALGQLSGTAADEHRRADPHGEEEQHAAAAEAPYDASLDPRTGRPPLPIDALRLNRENELRKLRAGQSTEREAADEAEEEAVEDSDQPDDTDEADESEIEVELDDPPQEDSEDDQ